VRIGVFGGTFDPIHLGHLIVAEHAREALALDRVLFVPAGGPWHRRSRPQASAEQRVAMARLATADNPAFVVSTADAAREGPTYTVDTLAALQRDSPEARLVFLLGQDGLAMLPSWRTPERILALAEVAVLARPGAAPPDWAALEAAIPGAQSRLRLLESPLIAISATEVRERVGGGRSIRYLVPREVAAYIAERGLYFSGN
jgi:nicotinate-nucleotide adenylyltransferase